MPTPTPDEIADAAAQAAADGVASATVDGRSATAIDPLKQLELADRLKARQAAATSNSPWKYLRPSQVVPPGATS
jgi:hypothetical protein